LGYALKKNKASLKEERNQIHPAVQGILEMQRIELLTSESKNEFGGCFRSRVMRTAHIPNFFITLGKATR
jgi:hypothetical protein